MDTMSCDYSIQSPILDENAKVDNLLLPSSTEWNMDLLQTLFSADEVVLISNICLSPLASDDRLVWRCTTNGRFSVRSVYHLQLDLCNRNSCGSSESSITGNCWLSIW